MHIGLNLYLVYASTVGGIRDIHVIDTYNIHMKKHFDNQQNMTLTAMQAHTSSINTEYYDNLE